MTNVSCSGPGAPLIPGKPPYTCIAHMVEKMAKIAKNEQREGLILGEDVEARHWWWSPGAQCAHIGVLSRSISRAGAEGGHLHAEQPPPGFRLSSVMPQTK